MTERKLPMKLFWLTSLAFVVAVPQAGPEKIFETTFEDLVAQVAKDGLEPLAKRKGSVFQVTGPINTIGYTAKLSKTSSETDTAYIAFFSDKGPLNAFMSCDIA